MALISIHDLNHYYDNGLHALADINLEIADGEFVALVGPSGSGKTTLLRALAGFIQPSSGSIRFDHEEFFAASEDSGQHSWVAPEKRNLGMVFQDHAVWPHMTVAENVAYPLRRAGVDKTQIQQRVAETLDSVGLGDYAKRKPHQLSGGQRQRVALARAVVANPQALLLDEALSALDEPLRARLRLQLRRLTREHQLTAVHVTHDRTEAMSIADRVVVLNAGKIVQVGTPAELRQAPATSFVAGFLADATLFPGSAVDERFYPDHPGASFPTAASDALRFTPSPDGQHRSGTQRAVAAVLPSEFVLHPAEVANTAATPEADPGLARVTSVLHSQYGQEVGIDWAGQEVRVFWTGEPVTEGDVVRPQIRRALVYLEDHA